MTAAMNSWDHKSSPLGGGNDIVGPEDQYSPTGGGDIATGGPDDSVVGLGLLVSE